jgi:antitoxin PrlF
VAKGKKSGKDALPALAVPSGFGEQQAAFIVDGHASAFAEEHSSTLTVGPAGRVLIPADIRIAMGIAEGDALVATLDGQELRLMSTKAALRKAQAMVAEYVPAHVSLVDDLIAERRREFELEERRYGGHADPAGVKARKDRP